MRARTSPILHPPFPSPNPHPPLEIVDVENVARKIEQLELMPLPQQVHNHRPCQAEAVPELHGIRDTRLGARFKGGCVVRGPNVYHDCPGQDDSGTGHEAR